MPNDAWVASYVITGFLYLPTLVGSIIQLVREREMVRLGLRKILGEPGLLNVKWSYVRLVFMLSILGLLRAPDPHGLWLYPIWAADMFTHNMTMLLVVAIFIAVCVCIRLAYTNLNAESKAVPRSVTLVKLTALSLFVACNMIPILNDALDLGPDMRSSMNYDALGVYLLMLAAWEMFWMLWWDVTTLPLIKVFRSISDLDANGKIKSTARRLLIFQITCHVLAAFVVPLQVINANDDPVLQDPDHYEFNSSVIFIYAQVLSTYLFLWYAWRGPPATYQNEPSGVRIRHAGTTEMSKSMSHQSQSRYKYEFSQSARPKMHMSMAPMSSQDSVVS